VDLATTDHLELRELLALIDLRLHPVDDMALRHDRPNHITLGHRQESFKARFCLPCKSFNPA
jgi:hypothetical protein